MSKITVTPTPGWQSLRWPMPLQQPPRARLMACATHGPQITERHCLDGLWSVHFYSYRATLELGETRIPVRPGFVGILPPGTAHCYYLHEKATHLCGHFALPPAPDAEGTPMPVMQDLGDDFAGLHAAFEEGAGWLSWQPARADARLWDILWRLTDREPPAAPDRRVYPAAVRRACDLIEQDLAQPWNIPRLAQAVGVSHNHLTRQFQAVFGVTVVAYIRRRRVERAEHLLRSTDLPVKTIAVQVGIDDPRLFNKMVHQERGLSPQALRRTPLPPPEV